MHVNVVTELLINKSV